MTQSLSARVKSLGFTLPEPSVAVGNYVPRLRVGGMLYISGQLPVFEGKPRYVGQIHSMDNPQTSERRADEPLGSDAIKAAELCALNILAQIAAEVDDDMDKVAHVVRLGGFVNCGAQFTDHAKVVNGASDLIVSVFGAEVGMHVRAATGASSLPLNATVEVDAIVALK